jgi:hypothetical protein
LNLRLSRSMQIERALLGFGLAAAPGLADRRLSAASEEGSGTMQATSPVVELLVPPKVGLGDTVEITLRLRNDGSRSLDLQLPGRPVAFDIIILGPDGTEVWRRLAQGMVSSALMLLRLPPGEARDFVAHWDQVGNDGRRAAPGTYRVQGILPTDKGVWSTQPRQLLIERGN